MKNRKYLIAIMVGVALTPYAVEEANQARGYFAIGGEWLIIPLILITWFLIQSLINFFKIAGVINMTYIFKLSDGNFCEITNKKILEELKGISMMRNKCFYLKSMGLAVNVLSLSYHKSECILTHATGGTYYDFAIDIRKGEEE